MTHARYAGAEWIRSALKKELSPLGVAVADLLGDVFAGIYHLADTELRKVDWDDTHFMLFYLVGRSLATFDSETLTKLVVLAHDRMLRVDISAAGRGKLELMFHLRASRTGDLMRRMPTMETHLAAIRKYYPAEPAEPACAISSEVHLSDYTEAMTP